MSDARSLLRMGEMLINAPASTVLVTLKSGLCKQVSNTTLVINLERALAYIYKKNQILPLGFPAVAFTVRDPADRNHQRWNQRWQEFQNAVLLNLTIPLYPKYMREVAAAMAHKGRRSWSAGDIANFHKARVLSPNFGLPFTSRHASRLHSTRRHAGHVVGHGMGHGAGAGASSAANSWSN